jgi:hypothetical protein
MLFRINQQNDSVNSYEDVYKLSVSAEIVLIKIRALIQMERPRSWSENNLKMLINDIMKIDKYSCTTSGKMLRFTNRWSKLKAWLEELT